MTLGSPWAASSAAPDAPQHQTGKARVIGTDSPRAIKDRYIVVMDKTTTATQRGNAISQARSNGGKVHFSYSSGARGIRCHAARPRCRAAPCERDVVVHRG